MDFWRFLVLFSLVGSSVPVTACSPKAPGSFPYFSPQSRASWRLPFPRHQLRQPLSRGQCPFFLLFPSGQPGMDFAFLEVSGSILSPASGFPPLCPAVSFPSWTPDPPAAAAMGTSRLPTVMSNFGCPLRSQFLCDFTFPSLLLRVVSQGYLKGKEPGGRLVFSCPGVCGSPGPALQFIPSFPRPEKHVCRTGMHLTLRVLNLDSCGLLDSPGTTSDSSLCLGVSLSRAMV